MNSNSADVRATGQDDLTNRRTEERVPARFEVHFNDSQEAAKAVTETGNLSVNPKSNEGLTGIQASVAQAFAKVAESDGSQIFPDQSAPALLEA